MLRQNVLVLYLDMPALDGRVVGWSQWNGADDEEHMAGDAQKPPYPTGLAALRDGWRLLQMSQLDQHAAGTEFRTGYLKYEFLFEQLLSVDAAVSA